MKNSKYCKKCNQHKSLEEFHKNKTGKDGLSYYCKICTCYFNKLYYTRAKPERAVKNKQYRTLHNKEIRLYREKIKHTPNRRYADYKRRMKRKNLPLSLSLAEFDRLTQLPCNYCGDYSSKNPIFNGIDRLDSSKGYTPDNSVPCCEICNLMKSDYVMEEWINHIQKIVFHLHKRGLFSEIFERKTE